MHHDQQQPGARSEFVHARAEQRWNREIERTLRFERRLAEGRRPRIDVLGQIHDGNLDLVRRSRHLRRRTVYGTDRGPEDVMPSDDAVDRSAQGIEVE